MAGGEHRRPGATLLVSRTSIGCLLFVATVAVAQGNDPSSCVSRSSLRWMNFTTGSSPSATVKSSSIGSCSVFTDSGVLSPAMTEYVCGRLSLIVCRALSVDANGSPEWACIGYEGDSMSGTTSCGPLRQIELVCSACVPMVTTAEASPAQDFSTYVVPSSCNISFIAPNMCFGAALRPDLLAKDNLTTAERGGPATTGVAPAQTTADPGQDRGRGGAIIGVVIVVVLLLCIGGCVAFAVKKCCCKTEEQKQDTSTAAERSAAAARRAAARGSTFPPPHHQFGMSPPPPGYYPSTIQPAMYGGGAPPAVTGIVDGVVLAPPSDGGFIVGAPAAAAPMAGWYTAPPAHQQQAAAPAPATASSAVPRSSQRSVAAASVDSIQSGAIAMTAILSGGGGGTQQTARPPVTAAASSASIDTESVACESVHIATSSMATGAADAVESHADIRVDMPDGGIADDV